MYWLPQSILRYIVSKIIHNPRRLLGLIQMIAGVGIIVAMLITGLDYKYFYLVFFAIVVGDAIESRLDKPKH